jgi:hypothetical protein
MTGTDVANLRLRTQHLARPATMSPAALVAQLGAVQSQDYGGAKWALGQRLAGANDALIEQAFHDGAILRTHVMRPTWHFVAPGDIRWLLALTAPRVHRFLAYYNRQLGLDEAVFARSNAVLERALAGGGQLTRTELKSEFEQAGIATDGTQRLAHLVMHAELEGILCSGPRRGKQFTYMLLEERVPPAPPMTRDEALATLVHRYFTSHGPATPQDFAWWSGLTIADAQRGIHDCGAALRPAEMSGRNWWLSSEPPPDLESPHAAHMLPNYDEYTVSYRSHEGVFDVVNADRLLFNHILLLHGRVAGTWKRTLAKRSVLVETDTFAPLTADERLAVAAAAERYGAFLGLPVALA